MGKSDGYLKAITSKRVRGDETQGLLLITPAAGFKAGTTALKSSTLTARAQPASYSMQAKNILFSYIFARRNGFTTLKITLLTFQSFRLIYRGFLNHIFIYFSIRKHQH